MIIIKYRLCLKSGLHAVGRTIGGKIDQGTLFCLQHLIKCTAKTTVLIAHIGEITIRMNLFVHAEEDMACGIAPIMIRSI